MPRRGDADRRLQRTVNRVDAQQPRLRAICGMNDCTAGGWIPPPAERMTRTTRISPVSPQPTAILADRHMVTAAMTASGSMTNSLRFHLSAQTPPNTETIACGRAAATIAPVMTMPEFDRKTRYQKIAYCTTLEPNSDSVCSMVCRPIQCITGRAVHVVLVPTPRSWITACLPLRAAAHHVRRQGRAIDVRVNAHLMYKVVLSWEDKARCATPFDMIARDLGEFWLLDQWSTGRPARLDPFAAQLRFEQHHPATVHQRILPCRPCPQATVCPAAR